MKNKQIITIFLVLLLLWMLSKKGDITEGFRRRRRRRWWKKKAGQKCNNKSECAGKLVCDRSIKTGVNMCLASPTSAVLNEGESCVKNFQCKDSKCVGGICRTKYKIPHPPPQQTYPLHPQLEKPPIKVPLPPTPAPSISLLEDGQRCSVDNECASGRCTGQGVCRSQEWVPLLRLLESCTSNSECATGYCSDQGFCSLPGWASPAPLLDEGQSCAEDNECAGGRCKKSWNGSTRTWSDFGICRQRGRVNLSIPSQFL